MMTVMTGTPQAPPAARSAPAPASDPRAAGARRCGRGSKAGMSRVAPPLAPPPPPVARMAAAAQAMACCAADPHLHRRWTAPPLPVVCARVALLPSPAGGGRGGTQPRAAFAAAPRPAMPAAARRSARLSARPPCQPCQAAAVWWLQEHSKLADLVAEHGTYRRWSTIAQSLPGRTGKQCRERWLNHMVPNIKKVGRSCGCSACWAAWATCGARVRGQAPERARAAPPPPLARPTAVGMLRPGGGLRARACRRAPGAEIRTLSARRPPWRGCHCRELTSRLHAPSLRSQPCCPPRPPPLQGNWNQEEELIIIQQHAAHGNHCE